MPPRLSVPPPTPDEERRQLAEVIAELHYILGLIIENGKEFLPGEALEEADRAWKGSQENIDSLVKRLSPVSPPSSDYPAIDHAALAENGLTGEVGKAKKNFFHRVKDLFLMRFNSEPRTAESKAQALDAASEVLEAGATITSSIPGHQQLVEVVSLVKQMINLRKKRGV